MPTDCLDCARAGIQMAAANHENDDGSLKVGVDGEVPVANLLIFPYCVCDDYRCASAPYKLMMQPPRLRGTQTELCFILESVSSDAAVRTGRHVTQGISTTPCAGRCCDLIRENLAKVEVEIRKDCKPQYDAAYLNGTWRTSYFDTEFATGKIRVTALNLPPTTAPGSEICFRFDYGPMGSTCNTFQNTCEAGDGSCNLYPAHTWGHGQAWTGHGRNLRRLRLPPTVFGHACTAACAYGCVLHDGEQ
eukprot:366261-Chlamydomonas_euryale.AAC.1